jgi:hypothetical protein
LLVASLGFILVSSIEQTKAIPTGVNRWHFQMDDTYDSYYATIRQIDLIRCTILLMENECASTIWKNWGIEFHYLGGCLLLKLAQSMPFA